jgi:hypothetical protein
VGASVVTAACRHCGENYDGPDDADKRWCRKCGHFCEDLERQVGEGLVSFCYCHYVAEPIPGDVHRICGECFHVYPTAQSLVDAYNREINHIELIPLVDFPPDEPMTPKTLEQVDEIWFCQECLHDF